MRCKTKGEPDTPDFLCWRNKPEGSIPAWVFRHFHNLSGDGRLTGHGPQGLVTAEVGDWIVWNPGEGKAVMKDAEFNRVFEILAEPEKSNRA